MGQGLEWLLWLNHAWIHFAWNAWLHAGISATLSHSTKSLRQIVHFVVMNPALASTWKGHCGSSDRGPSSRLELDLLACWSGCAGWHFFQQKWVMLMKRITTITAPSVSMRSVFRVDPKEWVAMAMREREREREREISKSSKKWERDERGMRGRNRVWINVVFEVCFRRESSVWLDD